MSFCKVSHEYVANNSTNIENAFFSEFMPSANENCVKVYLYGLYKCNDTTSANTLEDFSKKLNISKEDIISSFMFWEEVGLVSIVSKEPFEIRYLPVKNGSIKLKKFNVNKYTKFNILAQEILNGRVITPTEFQEYYLLMESMHIEKDALIMIIKFCADKKGNNVNYPYILQVAKNWSYEGVKTPIDVEERLLSMQNSEGMVLDILKALGLKRSAVTDEEFQLFLRWTKEMKLPHDNILMVAQKCKNKAGGFNRLNVMLEKVYNLNLNSVKEINDYFKNEEEFYNLAKEICRTLGVRYDNYETVVENYIINWIGLGFDTDTLNQIAVYCFKTTIRTLQGMDEKVSYLFKQGLVTSSSIDNFIADTIKEDEKIKEILEKIGINRRVVASDRMLYQTWTNTWKHSQELMDYVAMLSVGKQMPLSYFNKILSIYYINKITTVEEAKASNISVTNKKSVAEAKKPIRREYTASQLNSLFDSVYEVEVS